MNSLRSFVTLQARLYEFLEQQDEATLQGIVSGTVQLAILPTGDAQAPVSSVTREDQAVQDLRTLPSEHERLAYLKSTGFNKKQLQTMAKLVDLKRYSHLPKPDLMDLLAGHGPNQTGSPSREPRTLSPVPVDDSSEDEEQPTDTAKPDADVVAIAARLREIETEEEGAAYLRTQRLDRERLLAVAAELQLTRVDRLKPSELEKRVLKQAIGARRKFAGLRRW